MRPLRRGQLTAPTTAALVEEVFREDQGRSVGALVRSFGDLTLAEEAVQEAYAEALRRWATAVPDNPAAWIITTARNRAIDKLRRGGRLEAKTAEMAVELDRQQHDDDANPFGQTIVDDRLRLVFTCCHPSLATEAQIALTLRLVGGLTTPQIAHAFLVPEATMAARITRAKKRLRASEVPFRVPPDHELQDRLAAVLKVVYLVFNQGYLPAGGQRLIDAGMTTEAIRLGRLLHRLMGDEPEVAGLLALMLLIDSRRDARARGYRIVQLEAQDRSRWDGALIEEGCELVQAALRRGRPGPYQLQAAIQALHAEATSWDDTDWPQIAGLYAVLRVADPSPVVALNHAVAVSLAQGPAEGLAMVDPLVDELARYHLLHAARASMLNQLDRTEEALQAYRTALKLTGNEMEQRFLRDRISELGRV